MIKFGRYIIPGYTHTPQAGSPQVRVRRTHNWGREGILEVRSAPGGRDIAITHVLVVGSEGSEYKLVTAKLLELDGAIGQNGRLEVYGHLTAAASVASHLFINSTFDEWTQLPFPGQESAGPIKDLAGCFGGGWIMKMQLRFHQVLPRRAQAGG